MLPRRIHKHWNVCNEGKSATIESHFIQSYQCSTNRNGRGGKGVPIESHFIQSYQCSTNRNGRGGKGVTIESHFIQSYHCSTNQLKSPVKSEIWKLQVF